jgi:hypothetical protein
MAGGEWTIVIQAPNIQIAVQRVFNLIPSAPETVEVTVSYAFITRYLPMG